VAKFLLDANLSPRVARFLADRFHLDVTSLQGQGLGQLPDHEVITLARRQGRVIITLDQDYSDYFLDAPRPPVGIIYLDLTSRLRYIPAINRVLADFFAHHAATIDLEDALVVIREDGIVIHRGA
jgi:predicted nuclease of predicted toxin-antitoxin system